MLKIIKRLPPVTTAIAVLFVVIQVFCTLSLPTLTAGIVNEGVLKGDSAFIWRQGRFMLLFSVAGLTAALVNTYVAAQVAYGLGSDLRLAIYKRVTCFANDEFDKIGPASLITRNTNDVSQVQSLVEMGLKFMIMAPFYLVGGIFLAWRLSPTLSMAFVCAAPFIVLTCVLIFRTANPLFMKLQQKIDGLNLIFREGLTGVKVIRAFNRERWEFKRYQHANASYTDSAIKVNTLMGVLMPLTTMIMSLASIAITWMGARGVASGTIEIGTIIGVITYSTQILMGFLILANIITLIPRGQTSAHRIYEVLDMEASIKNPDFPLTINIACASLAAADVSFRYQNAEQNALHHISFSISRGQTLAVIGGTGSGKSTLVNLIGRFYDVTEGSIKLCGVDIRYITQEELHGAVSLVPQQNFLFAGTIRDNIRMGKPDAADDEIWAALTMAAAAEFVADLPEGLDSPVAKGGGNFSGGQKQRLCIARALIKPAHVYLFDDSFSALDFKTDAQIRQAMQPKLKNALSVVVAQRISTVMQADLILVLDEGRVAGLGRHAELAAHNQVYREILQSQFEREAA